MVKQEGHEGEDDGASRRGEKCNEVEAISFAQPALTPERNYNGGEGYSLKLEMGR